MHIKVTNTGQLKNFNILINNKINFIYAENGTGKTTLSRILSSTYSENSLKKLQNYTTQNSKIILKINEKEFLYQDDKWNKASNNFFSI